MSWLNTPISCEMKMMIVIIRGTAYPNKCQELVQTFASLARKMRRVPGCLSLHFSRDIEDENTFYCVEHWQTREEMNAHFLTELFTVLLGGLELLCASQDMQVYTVSRRSGKEVIDAARNDMKDNGLL